MRNKIVLITLVVIIGVALGVGVAIQQQKYNQAQARTAQAVQARQAELDIKNKVEINGWQGRYAALVKECQKGVTAYGLLTPQNKATTQQPNCSPTVGQ